MTAIADNGGSRRGNPLRWMVWGFATLLLLLPAIAMQFTDDVDWDARDFTLIGVILFACCATYEMAARYTGSRWYRAGVGIAVVAAFLMIWINLAVGMIATESNLENLIFAVVLLVGIVGGFVTRFRPDGMARALVATAIAQALAGVVALGWAEIEAFVLSGFFTAVWLLSAWLFRQAALKGSEPHTPV